jgi:hypothetical protein
MNPGEDAAFSLARFAAELTYDQLPLEVVSAVKLVILDSLGTTLAATTLGNGCPEFVRVVQGLRQRRARPPLLIAPVRPSTTTAACYDIRREIGSEGSRDRWHCTDVECQRRDGHELSRGHHCARLYSGNRCN